jgi:hypothetical protein
LDATLVGRAEPPVARIDPARTEFILLLPTRAAAALEPLLYVPDPPNVRTDDAACTEDMPTVHSAQTKDTTDTFITLFISSLF